MKNCCNDFTRSQLLHHATARAGAGLPSIETGMPTPAGSGMTRRSMLLGGAGMFLTVYGADKLGLDAFELRASTLIVELEFGVTRQTDGRCLDDLLSREDQLEVHANQVFEKDEGVAAVDRHGNEAGEAGRDLHDGEPARVSGNRRLEQHGDVQ